MTVSDDLDLRYTLTEGDFVRTLRTHALKQPWRWVIWIIYGAMLLFGAISAVLGIAEWGLNAGFVLMLVLLTVFPAVLFWCVWWWHPKRCARASPHFDVEIKGAVSVDGIASRSRLGKHETAWASYSTVLESVDHFLLYLGRNVFSPFPKRAFTDPKDVDRFRDLIRAHVPNARLLDLSQK